MMDIAKKNALGRGLGALIEGVEKEVLEKKVEANKDIPVNLIDVIHFSRGAALMNRHSKNLLLQ
jgi:hypothetical protein